MADDTLTQKALEKIATHEAEILRLKIFVNEADKLNDVEPRFGDLNLDSTSTSAPSGRRWSAGEFFNKPFSTAVKQVLLSKVTALGTFSPMSLDEIHDALTQGSFDFGTSGAEAQKNGIRISLGKNSAMFVRLPNTDLFGLVEWYGKKAGKPGKKPAMTVEVTTEQETDSDCEKPDDSNVTELKASAA